MTSLPFLQRFWLFVLFGLTAAFVLTPLASNTMLPAIGDIYNHIAAITQAKTALAEGQFPLRVAPLEQSSFNYPFYQFYSPTSYTLAGYIYSWLTPSNPYMAYKVTLWGSLVIGGFFIYALVTWLIKNRLAAILASLVYLTSPYTFIVIDHMGAFNEGIALGIQPAVLYFTLQLYYQPASYKNLLQTSIAWYLLATIHLVTFIYASCFMGLLLIFLTLSEYRTVKNLFKAGLGYVLGCLLAIWFLAPIVLFKKYFFIIQTLNQFSPQTLMSLFSLIINATNTYHSQSHDIHPAIGLPILISVGLCLYAVFKKNISTSDKRHWVISLLLLFFIAFMLIWSPFNLWLQLPDFLKVGQYSWRLLSQLIWIGALLFAWAIHWLLQSKLGPRSIIIGSVLLMLTTTVWLQTPELVYIKLADVKRPTLSFFSSNYLINTIDDTKMPTIINHNKAGILSINSVMPYCQRGNKAFMQCVVPITPEIQLIELPLLYYPYLLHITVNGHEAPYMGVLFQDTLIAATLSEPGQINIIQFEFRGLLWANYLSSMAWLLTIILFCYLMLRSIFYKNSAEFVDRIKVN